jgi:hypothetical protein
MSFVAKMNMAGSKIDVRSISAMNSSNNPRRSDLSSHNLQNSRKFPHGDYTV